MPIFEYLCSQCGHQFEELILPKSPAPECPVCRSQDLTKQISVPAVSSEGTHQRALRDGKGRSAKIRKEMAHEEHKRIHNHEH